MTAIPLTGSTPDIFNAEPFFLTRSGPYLVLAFRDIEPLAARNGRRAILTYPLVMAVLERNEGGMVFAVTVEVGQMLGTCCLCAFDEGGRHLNMGNWDLALGEDAFVRRALETVRARFDLPPDTLSPINHRQQTAPPAPDRSRTAMRALWDKMQTIMRRL